MSFDTFLNDCVGLNIDSLNADDMNYYYIIYKEYFEK
jgi:hypothetical protein